jgi:hypothetical protein
VGHIEQRAGSRGRAGIVALHVVDVAVELDVLADKVAALYRIFASAAPEIDEV